MVEERRIPATMSTQHPDNARIPSWCKNEIIDGDMEIYEAYFAFSSLGCHEVMWDSEGKDVDTRVVRKLLDNYANFFSDYQLGRDIFLTYRIPNPKIEGAERKVLVETLQNIPVAYDVASTFYKNDVAPIFEVILPFTTDAKELIWLYNYYGKAIIGAGDVPLDDDVKARDWVGSFKPEKIQVIPLIEDFDSILSADKIIEPYVKAVKPKSIRVFIARSDPALNYGLLCAVLLSKIAFSKLKELEKKLGISVYPILGVGSMPFRGHLSPENIEGFLNENRGLSTVTIQSAIKYDYPIEKATACISTLNRRLPNGEPIVMETSEEKKVVAIMHKSRKFYGEIVEELAPIINGVASYVPARRARKLHIGLFGYSRRIGGIVLPRAIPFAASLYTLGLPPELLGSKIFADLKEDEWRIIQKYYVNLRHDLDVAGGYLSWRNMEMLADSCETIAKKVGMSKKKLKMALAEVLSSIESMESTFGVKLGPKDSLTRKHENFVNNFLISYMDGDEVEASSSLLRAAEIRRCLG